MKSHVAAFALLGIVVASPSDVLDVQRADVEQATYCITYESTYLVPISLGANSSSPELESTTKKPVSSSSDSVILPQLPSTHEVITTAATVDTQQPPLPTDSTTTPPIIGPVGQRVILLVTPSGQLTKREIGGFVGSGNPSICTFAAIFILGQDRLFAGDFPIAYSGERFQPLQASPRPASNSITTTFSNEGGFLAFSNPSLPGGKASFCQTPSDGQVYITYSSKPSGCIFVALTVYEAERCIDGRIDGLETLTTAATQSESTEVTDSPIDPTVIPDTTEVVIPDNTDNPPIFQTSDGGIIFPTLTIDPTRSWMNATSGASTVAQSPEVATSADNVSSITDEVPLSTDESLTSFQSTSIVQDSSSSDDSFDPVVSTTLASDQAFSSTDALASTSDISITDEGSTLWTEVFESSTTLFTMAESPSATLTTTATELEAITTTSCSTEPFPWEASSSITDIATTTYASTTTTEIAATTTADETYACENQMKFPSPTGAACGEEGNPIAPQENARVIGYGPASSVFDCYKACMEKPNCDTFIISENNFCDLWKGTLGEMDGSDTGYKWYETRCFCDTGIDQAPRCEDTNLVKNPGWDTGKFSPWKYYPVAEDRDIVDFEIKAGGADGTGFRFQTGNFHYDKSMWLYQDLNACPGTTFRCTFKWWWDKYYAIDQGDDIYLVPYVRIYQDNDKYAIISEYPRSEDQTQRWIESESFDFTIPESGETRIWYIASSPQGEWINTGSGPYSANWVQRTNALALDSLICQPS